MKWVCPYPGPSTDSSSLRSRPTSCSRSVASRAREQPVLVGPVVDHDGVGQLLATGRELDLASTAVGVAHRALDQALLLEPVDPLRDGARGHHRGGRQVTGAEPVRRTRATQRGEYVEVAVAESRGREDGAQLALEQVGEPVQASDDRHRSGVELGPLPGPLGHDAVDGVLLAGHELILPSTETKLSSVETNRLSTILVTAVAPVAWGSTYIVTESVLPPGRPSSPPRCGPSPSACCCSHGVAGCRRATGGGRRSCWGCATSPPSSR